MNNIWDFANDNIKSSCTAFSISWRFRCLPHKIFSITSPAIYYFSSLSNVTELFPYVCKNTCLQTFLSLRSKPIFSNWLQVEIFWVLDVTTSWQTKLKFYTSKSSCSRNLKKMFFLSWLINLQLVLTQVQLYFKKVMISNTDKLVASAEVTFSIKSIEMNSCVVNYHQLNNINLGRHSYITFSCHSFICIFGVALGFFFLVIYTILLLFSF